METLVVNATMDVRIDAGGSSCVDENYGANLALFVGGNWRSLLFFPLPGHRQIRPKRRANVVMADVD